MLVLVKSFSFNPDASFSESPSYTPDASFSAHLMVVLRWSFSYTSHASFSEVFLLHSWWYF